MVACPKCVVNNTLDSAFCKKCGAILPISMIEEEQEKLKEIVTKGMESYQNGNLEEAMAIADHSILTNPSYGEAYALKGLVHERNRAYAEALDAYESVVALNPDSTIDKIKLNQLRNAFAQRQAGEPKADRKGAALISIGVAAACLAIGTISYGVIQGSKETKSNAMANNSPVQQNPERLANRENTGQPGINVIPNKQNPAPNGEVGALNTEANPPIDSRVRSNNNGGRSSGGGFIPGPITVDPPTGDINPRPDKTLPTGRRDGGNGGEPEKQPQKPNIKSVPDEGTIDPPVSSGTIDIQVISRGTGSGSKGTESPQSGNSGKVLQRQGLAHQRSGKSAEARAAFQKAIDAFQKEIDSGKGDKDAAVAGINSSKQALKNIKD